MFSKKIFFLALAVVVTAAGAICMSRKKKRDDPFSENEPSDENPSEGNPPCGEQAASSQEEADLIISKANQSEETLLKSWEEDINAFKVSWSEHTIGAAVGVVIYKIISTVYRSTIQI